MNLEKNGKVYFTEQELKCKGSGLLILAPGFADKLIELRIAFGRPMVVNSCCRSFQHNKNVKGNERSLHVCDKPYWPTGGTCAIDIGTTDPIYRAQLTKLALEKGWSVGFNAAFLHLDRRVDFGISTDPIVFLY